MPVVATLDLQPRALVLLAGLDLLEFSPWSVAGVGAAPATGFPSLFLDRLALKQRLEVLKCEASTNSVSTKSRVDWNKPDTRL